MSEVGATRLDSLATDRTLVMGVVNVTPDSFSDGGRWFDADTAIRHGIALAGAGADLVDVGGESTRPGALRVDSDEERRRVMPVVRGLVSEGIAVSVDTMRAALASEALDAGAALVNDVSGGRADPQMLAAVAAAQASVVLMHWREHSAQMDRHTTYDDLVGDIVRELGQQVDAAVAAGVDLDRIVLDPGLGFSKTGDQNWTVLAHLDAFAALGRPLLVAASRKRFLGELLAHGGVPRPIDEREHATAAVSALCAQAGVWCVRVHDPGASVDAVRVVARLRRETARPGSEGHHA